MIWALLPQVLVACAPHKPPEPEQTQLRVLTWNLYYGASERDGVERILAELDADLVLLQETNPAWQERLEGLYPYSLWAQGPGRGGGVAALSKLPIEQLAEYRVEGAPFPAQLLALSTPFGPLQVLNVHLRAPFAEHGGLPVGFFTTKRPRKIEVEQLLAKGIPDLVCGDMNANEREPSIQQFEEVGLISALPSFDPGQRTWHGPGDMPVVWRIDHCMVGPALVATEARVLEQGPSDHWPLLVGLRPAGR